MIKPLFDDKNEIKSLQFGHCSFFLVNKRVENHGEKIMGKFGGVEIGFSILLI